MFMTLDDLRSAVLSFARSASLATALGAAALGGAASAAAAAPITIVALGDSLTAGYRLDKADSFPAKLEAALKLRGHDVSVVNAGVSGDTASGGLARLDWSVGEGVDAVIVELGANDALRGLPPARTREAIDTIVKRLTDRDISVLVAGMIAPPNLGSAFAEAFNPIFPEVAKAYGALYYPFFLDGIVADRALNLDDGIHPNPEGVDIIVSRILPSVERLIEQVKAR